MQYCIGTDVWQYLIHVTTSIILWGDICGNIQYHVERYLSTQYFIFCEQKYLAIFNIMYREIRGNIQSCFGIDMWPYSILCGKTILGCMQYCLITKIIYHCVGRYMWQYSVLRGDIYVVIFNIMEGDIFSNIRYCVDRYI